MRYFHSLGYTVIAPDLNGHGETMGNRKTFGYRESKDIESANRYLRKELGSKWVCALGCSLGGASILKAESDGGGFDAIIIESVFSDIRTAARNRLQMKMGAFGKYLEPLLTAQIPIWLGISRDDLNPVRWAEHCHTPILIFSGDADERAYPRESAAIFEHVPAPMKKIHLFHGAKHEDLFAYNPVEYKEEISRFMQQMNGTSTSPYALTYGTDRNGSDSVVLKEPMEEGMAYFTRIEVNRKGTLIFSFKDSTVEISGGGTIFTEHRMAEQPQAYLAISMRMEYLKSAALKTCARQTQPWQNTRKR